MSTLGSFEASAFQSRTREHSENANGILSMATGLTFDDLSRSVIHCALDVHRELGPGFMEKVYWNAMRVALESKGLEFVSEHRITVRFREVEVGAHQLDLVVKNQLVVELKAVRTLTEIHFAQLRSYLRAADLRVGLLFNFNAARLEIRRLVNRYHDISLALSPPSRFRV